MAFTNITLLKRASDLVVAHEDHNFSNANANITPPAASAPIPFGTVVFRAKGGADSAAWTILTVAAALVTTNEFAIVFGNHSGFAAGFVPRAIAAGKSNSIVIRRDAALKEYYIKEVHATALGADYPKLVGMLNAQGLLVLDDVSDLTI